MGILAWVILGGIAGWIASLVMHTDGNQGIFLNIVVGIIGAFIGGLVFNFFGGAGITGFNLYSLVVSVLGAVILLWLTKMVTSS
ncbi:GlsB/YeaQ/YmgE family stress response membrane protein [Candidatus Parcubacteria bacterium]|uniref:GlsB/YeaQ/YmgE family stress response membrane protein n=1 Tax=Candidatus Kaiserbacteria bacterium CG10_big_fil_rev_8_21_14_0_10_47_16 TaxID=1974608 RepID=A0A2H0UEZ4_9BACT|nr:GlsB/YeaQ/YmgE family stress response membrane protein [Candidatus Parcubacteria bacterium]PIR84345.1 MAG: GlsB/YeaQ/YmgE family stress response membrane protein [Candidatus Kaiserbacteria bacterium CG10_big_fil_rev_8_21_14_0_10_47_16]